MSHLEPEPGLMQTLFEEKLFLARINFGSLGKAALWERRKGNITEIHVLGRMDDGWGEA